MLFLISILFSNSQLIVYGAGHVIPSSLEVLKPDLEFSLMVAISTDVQYGRLVLVMDKNFCTDAAGNRFTRISNSSFLLHFGKHARLSASYKEKKTVLFLLSNVSHLGKL